MEAVSRYGISVLFGVPAVLRQVLNHPRFADYDLSSVRMVLAGGALGASTVNREFEEALGRPLDFLQIYGLTEPPPCSSRKPEPMTLIGPCSVSTGLQHGAVLEEIELAVSGMLSTRPAGMSALAKRSAQVAEVSLLHRLPR